MLRLLRTTALAATTAAGLALAERIERRLARGRALSVRALVARRAFMALEFRAMKRARG